ncbi:hypothetical protein HLB25_14315 [Dickeya dadantii]|uniref:hypothetical protein n=1 Tax=Dickeya dadantii TaxID=204038 RepID=UPI0014958630|nr:hypothetical protein [Dickeya dadantii]NPE56560.1 hypothetical protein [Dickeya dadantii]NPE59076.1 hypothetical protein [Dickeya dadantii]NPE67830.1 hypothetical protein [Dickeya dadantii]NPE69666.1 hypothetical protein [Dickeya dadantii]
MTGYLDSIAHPWTRQHIQMAIMSDFRTVQKSIDQTEGGQLWRSIKDLDDAIWVFTKSTSELLDKINEFGEKSKDIEFWHKTTEKNSEEYVREVKRQLYYCTSSLMTVVDISRALNKKWSLEDLVEQRNKFFSTPGLHDFLQKLRNFSSHWRIAQANWVIKSDFKNGTRFACFVVSKEELLEWGDWGSKAKKYIEEKEDSIDLYEVFTQYKKHAQQYYSWHKGALIDVYSSILQPFFEYKKIHEGLNNKIMWNMILSNFRPEMNPYQYLARYLSNNQIELILSYEHRSEQQVNALIRMLDMEDFCDTQLRAKAMRVFGVSTTIAD